MTRTLDDLRAELLTGRRPDPAYAAKMLHPIPAAPTVKREAFVLERCTGQVVLDIGASGPMHAGIAQVAARCYGLDRAAAPGVDAIDLDDYHVALPVHADVTLVVCGEVLEHLSNPGWLLTRLRAIYPCPALFSVPNAFAEIGRKSIAKGTENVNREHVAYYSWKTLDTLLRRHGYTPTTWAWYNGDPRVAEGLIVVTE